MPDESFPQYRLPPTVNRSEGAVCITDAAGIILRVNPAFCRMHGDCREDELVGHPVSVLTAISGTACGSGYLDLLRGAHGECAELRFPLPGQPGQPGQQVIATARVLNGMAGGRYTITTIRMSEPRAAGSDGAFMAGDPGPAILAMAGDGVVGTDARGVVDLFDAGAERLFGFSAAEVIGHNVTMLMPEAYRDHHDRYMAEGRAARRQDPGERQRALRGQRKDGTTFPVLLLINERTASPGGYLAVLLHDGDHEMNRVSLEQTSARLYDALGNLKEGFLLCDARDRVVLANTRLRALFPEIADLVVPGRSFTELVQGFAERGLYEYGDSDPEVWLAERLARHRRLPNQFEMDVRGGRRIEVRELATTEGACLTVYDDITERYQREQQLRDREAQLSTAQRIAQLGSWRVELRSGRVSWSEEMNRLFGLEPGTCHPTPEAVLTHIHPHDRERVRRLLIGPTRRKPVRQWEFRVIRPSGEERVLWAESQSECDATGQVCVRFGVCQDVTARKLDQIALVRAKEAAEAASASKSQFLANMSHELRTPLNAIIGFSEMMAGEVLGSLGNPRYHDYCDAILSSGRHLLDLINEVLDLAKIEAGRFELSEEWLPVAEAFGDALRLIGPRAAEKGMEIAGSAETAPMLRADRRAVRQMLLNLLSNAVKFTPRGGRITMRAAWDYSELRLEVSDTGIGIPTERIRELARPFVQVDTAINRRNAGTGIGLYITRSLIELHGGRLVITSRQDEPSGTTVALVFPSERLGFDGEP